MKRTLTPQVTVQITDQLVIRQNSVKRWIVKTDVLPSADPPGEHTKGMTASWPWVL
jgi:hypothetical protein